MLFYFNSFRCFRPTVKQRAFYTLSCVFWSVYSFVKGCQSAPFCHICFYLPKPSAHLLTVSFWANKNPPLHHCKDGVIRGSTLLRRHNAASLNDDNAVSGYRLLMFAFARSVQEGTSSPSSCKQLPPMYLKVATDEPMGSIGSNLTTFHQGRYSLAGEKKDYSFPSLLFAYFFFRRQTAEAAMPSPAPVKPKPSSVVAFTLT